MTAPPSRSATLETLERDVFDLLIVGGGITGAGVARDAAMRGLKVALVDKSDFGGGTSSKSSKLIHGGLRYLQNAEFGLVFEAVSERTRLLRLAPHLVRPLSFLVPTYKGQVPGLFMLDCGLWLYDALSKFAAPKRHKTYRKAPLLSLEPGLLPEGLRGGIVYFDSMTDDARLTLENIIDARSHGAVVASYTQVVGFLPASARDNDAPFEGAMVQDLLNPALQIQVRAKVTVNATGPWSDGVRSLTSSEMGAPLLRLTKGAHLVVDAARLPVKHAVVMLSPGDGRVMFAIPWSDPEDGAASRTVVGTTDTDWRGDIDEVYADRADVDYLLSTTNHYFPEARLTPGDVLSTYAGLRPLVAPAQKQLSASRVSREHRLVVKPGLLTIAGGKLTTYRRIAAHVVDAALVQLGKKPRDLPCPTANAPLPGGSGIAATGGVAAVVAALVALDVPGLDQQVARHLARTYGMRSLALGESLSQAGSAERLDAELPYLLAEVDLAVGEEAAMRLEDVLARRLPLLLRARDQGLGCAERVASRMAGLLGWSDTEKQGELARYRHVVALSRRFQEA